MTNGTIPTARLPISAGLSVVPGPLLAVEDLGVRYDGTSGSPPVRAVEGVSFSLDRAETLGIIGESGSGKTSLALAILHLLPSSGRVVSGAVRLNGRDLLTMTRSQLDRKRWKSISIAFQGAMNALNPLQPILRQVAEPLLVHEGLSRKAANARALDYLGRVGIQKERASAFPHELSGGMRQRAVIAMALVCEPEMIIADEPGTALDVVVQRQVLELLLALQREFRLAMLVISHDLSVIEFMTHRCLVMYGGRVVEQGPTHELFEQPRHPYLQALVRSFPRIDDDHFDLVAIPDKPVDRAAPQIGCVFNARCPLVMNRCCDDPPPPDFPAGEQHSVACWLAEAGNGG